MSTTTHKLMGGKLNLYKRENSRYWQCSTFVQGRNRRASTKEESLAAAKDFAEDWYLEIQGKLRRGEVLAERTFAEAAKVFEKEYETITGGDRSPKWVRGHKDRIRLHLNPFFGNLGLSEITPGKVQEYRVHRVENVPEGKKPPSRSTLHDEVVTMNQVLKTAQRHGWLQHLPNLSTPYRTAGKIRHRPWFSPREYKQLYEATRASARNPAREQDRAHAEDLHDFVLLMANTGLRPDEAYNLEHRDIEIVEDDVTEERLLEIEVRGKRGVGYCKSTANAVRPYQRIVKRQGEPKPTDKVFPNNHVRMFNTILDKQGLKHDRDGQRRTSYSLRHTYICLRLMEGADIYQIAKNCRTSVEMIEKYYAAHIKNRLDAAAINIRKPKKRKKKPEGDDPGAKAQESA